MNPSLRLALDEILEAAAEPAGELAAPAATGRRLQRIRTALQRIVERFHARGDGVDDTPDDELLLHASPALTVYRISLGPGLRYPPHEHRMDALIGLYRGGETNFAYAAGRGDLPAPTRHDMLAPAVAHLPPDTVHAVANTGAARSAALHVYLGDLLRTPRRMWDERGRHPAPFDNARYLAGAHAVGIDLDRSDTA